MNVIIFGPPGAGKGTQAYNIAKKFNLYQVSTGDILRNEIKNQTDVGKDIENIISKGESASLTLNFKIYCVLSSRASKACLAISVIAPKS